MSLEALDAEPEYIVSAAVEINGVPCPTVAHEDVEEGGADRKEGFLTNKGRFLDRKDAYILAEGNDQLIPGTISVKEKSLHSADFWEWDVLQERKRLYSIEQRT